MATTTLPASATTATVSAVPEDHYAANRSWEAERFTQQRLLARNALATAVMFALVAALALAAVIRIESQRQFVAVPIVVDRSTGETTTTAVLASETVPLEEALDKAGAARYVKAREGYAWDFLQRDYDSVARMSASEVFKPYSSQFEGNDALHKRLGAGTIWRIRVISVRLDLARAKTANRGGEAVVTYEREARNDDRGVVEPPMRAVATLRYEYRPKAAMTEADRLDNPLGFVVTAYRSDAELGARR